MDNSLLVMKKREGEGGRERERERKHVILLVNDLHEINYSRKSSDDFMKLFIIKRVITAFGNQAFGGKGVDYLL